MSASMEMPKYVSHKTVWALKIKTIRGLSSGGAMIDPEDKGYGEFPVDESYMNKHEPKPGGYYVVYSDGYKSYSPAKAFEDGYTPLNGV